MSCLWDDNMTFEQDATKFSVNNYPGIFKWWTGSRTYLQYVTVYL